MPEVYISDEVADVINLYSSIEPTSNVHSLLFKKSKTLLAGHQSKHPGSAVEITSWFPALVGKSAYEIFNTNFELEDAQLTVSRIHGFSNWAEVENSPLELQQEFEKAVDYLLNGNVSELQNLLIEYPYLAKSHSQFPHQATLLHYCASNGIETERQVVPNNLLELVDLLLDLGSDKQSTMKVYNGSYTAHDLASTSAHPQGAGLTTALCKKLK